MALQPNSRLGPYEILSLLGVGGMGEVYRARDPRIGREVAVKVLPPRFAADPEALRRFEQEARAAGVLNHPNVLAVYDVGSENGTHYVVSELLEGESLQDRLAHGPIPKRKAVAYALEVLRGLAAAHEKSIVHRDLKPANLFITRDDRIKILDFGLAKLLEPAPAQSDETQAMSPKTNPGLIMGSLGYMSPEQVRGHAVDHRSDIFAMGVVVYEMLSGKPAFHGDSAVECMNAILKEDPPPLEGMPAIDGVLRHCLEKRPELRFQSARDLAFALEAAGAEGSTGTPAAIAPAIKTPRRIPWLWIAAVLGTAAIAALAYQFGRADRMEQPVYHRLGLYHGESLMGIVRHRFSPDGQTIVVGGHHGVTFTRVDNPAVRSLNLHKYSLLSVSSSGDLALLSDGGVLAMVPFSGGAPRDLLENVVDADWTPDGKDLAAIRRVGSKNVLEYPIGHAIYQTSNGMGSLRVSPKEESVAFFEYDADKRSVVLVRKNGERKVLSPGWTFASHLAWTPDGREIWFGANKSGYDFPISSVDLTGHVRLVQRLPGRLLIEDISKDGRVLEEYTVSRAGIAYRGPADSGERDLSWLDFTVLTAISNDGSRVLFSESGESTGGRRLVYLRDTSGAEAVRLGEGQAMSLTPDGKFVLALAEEDGNLAILPTGAGQPRIVKGPGKLHEAGVILPDGRILCWAQELGHGSRLYLQDGANWKPITPEFGDPRAGFQALLSPSGDRVVARHGDDLLLFSTATGEVRTVPGWSNSHIAGWTSDGKSLYQGRTNADHFEILKWNLETQKSEPWKRIEVKGVMPLWVRVTPDGRHYAYTFQVASTDAYVVTGLK